MGKIVKITKTIYGKIDWNIVKNILLSFLGKIICIKENNVKIKIDRKFIREFIGSKFTINSNKKIRNVKANIAGHLTEILENSGHIILEKNKKEKHKNDAFMGFEKYKCRFIIEDLQNDVKNEYSAIIVVRCPNFKEKYIYDIVDIKKASHPQ